MKDKSLVIFGTGDLAQIAYEYFTNDSVYEVVGFTVDDDHFVEKEFMGLSVVPFSRVEKYFHPDIHEMHVAIVYGDMNRLRARKCAEAKERGYMLASYISSKAFVSPNAEIGEHCFIFENNVIQSSVRIGNNAILWSGNHIGHHSVIGHNVFMSSHVVVSGWCDIGDNCFLGVNSTLANNTKVGKETWISHGAVMGGDIPSNSMVKSLSPNTGVFPLDEAALNRSLERASKNRMRSGA